jgi:hypothetical protein
MSLMDYGCVADIARSRSSGSTSHQSCNAIKFECNSVDPINSAIDLYKTPASFDSGYLFLVQSPKSPLATLDSHFAVVRVSIFRKAALVRYAAMPNRLDGSICGSMLKWCPAMG